jgi:hypothetical protein
MGGWGAIGTAGPGAVNGPGGRCGDGAAAPPAGDATGPTGTEGGRAADDGCVSGFAAGGAAGTSAAQLAWS